MEIIDFPFIGGRVNPDVLTENICRNPNLKLRNIFCKKGLDKCD